MWYTSGVIDLDVVSPERLMQSTRALARWTRLSGTAEERASAEYVAEQLRTMGYAVELITHDAYISLPGPAALRVAHPEARDLPVITHSMGIATTGMTAELVYAGRGTLGAHANAGTAGKFALVDGRASPQGALDATRAGALGVVCISGQLPHEMCCSPVWGNPAESTADLLPKVVLLSVARADGEALRALCRAGRVQIHVTAEVQTGWTPTPIVQGDLAGSEPTFVMLSGHLDSWYLGAMDNGSANATMLEVARLMAERRSTLRRGLRVLFWSGHSHGRYSSSAWYADTRFVELDERCVAHVNADSLGAIDADSFGTNSMPETAALAIEATGRVAGAKLEAKRVGRNSDQSFFGIGIPTILGSVSRQADGALGWWWHTPEDTIDKIDPARLARDARIFLHVVDRLLTEPVLPLDYAASAADIRAALEPLPFDLEAPISEARRLESACAQLGAAAGDGAARVNACLQQLGRLLIPVTYTAAGRHAHDPALDVPFLPKLQGARRLATLDPESDAARLLTVDLVRARSELTSALRRAANAAEACLRERRTAGAREASHSSRGDHHG